MGARRRVLVAGLLLALAGSAATQAATGAEGRGDRPSVSAKGDRDGPGTRVRAEPRSAAPAATAADPLLRIGAGGPAVRPGFPVRVRSVGGTYYCCQTAILVGDVDGDPDLETLLSGVALGGMTVVEPDGSPVPGWSDSVMSFHEWPTLIEADPGRPGFEVALREFDRRTAIVDGHGRPLPGWPRTPNSGVWGGVGAAADLDGDARDEYLSNDVAWQYDAFDSVGRVRRQGWPLSAPQAQQHLSAPLVVDLDHDGALDLVGGASQMSSPGEGLVPTLHAWSTRTGASLPGWPVTAGFQATDGMVAGDLDGNGTTEVVVGNSGIEVHSADGRLVRRMVTQIPAPSFTPPALADLDGDGRPEIVTVAHHDDAGTTTLHAFRYDGTEAPGYPVALPRAYGAHTISPVVAGDLDGDGRQDLAFTMRYYTPSPDVSGVLAFDHQGRTLPGFPFGALYVSDHVPAIADTDRNGRNELLFVVDEPVQGWTDRLYSVEYPTGTGALPQWGQFRGGPKRQGVLGQSLTPTPEPTAPASGSGPTTLVADVAGGSAGSGPLDLTVLPGSAAALYTAETSGSGRELWRTDGTAAGTSMVRDVRAGPSSSRPEELTLVGDQVYFAASGDGAGRELWRSDGTAAGTVRVTDIDAGAGDADPTELTAVGSTLFFVAEDGVERELWVLDGTGAHQVFDPTPADSRSSESETSNLVAAGNRLMFTTVRERGPELVPWTELGLSDGTAAGTTTHLGLGSHESGDTRTLGDNPDLRPAGGTGTSGGMAWLWTKNDLVAADSTRLAWSWPGLRDAYADYGMTGPPAGVGLDAVYGRTGELYRTTLTGTLNSGGLLHDFETDWSAPGDARGMPDGLVRLGSRTVMGATTLATGREPWSWADGAAAQPLGDLNPGVADSHPVPLGTAGSTLLLRATNAATGDELWATDGTPAGTRRLTDLAAGARGSHPGEAVVVGARVVLAADDGVAGRELWTLPLASLTVQEFTSAPTPTVAGDRRLSSTLVAEPGAWSPTPTSFAYQWFRDGRPVAGATARSLKLTAFDVDHRFAVRVTGVRAGWTTTARTSATTAVVTGWAFTSAPTPKVAGTPRLGYVLTADAGTWAPTPSVLVHQWYRSGVAVPGATSRLLKLSQADVGRSLSVRVTAHRLGFTTTWRTSAATATVTGSR